MSRNERATLAPDQHTAAEPEPYLKLEEEYSRETILLAEHPPTVKVKLHAIRIGQSGIVSSPCETFAEIGLAIKRQSPLEPTIPAQDVGPGGFSQSPLPSGHPQ